MASHFKRLEPSETPLIRAKISPLFGSLDKVTLLIKEHSNYVTLFGYFIFARLVLVLEKL